MASSSRNFTIDWNSTEIADVQAKSFNYTASLVNVTTDDHDGWETFLSVPGTRGITISISGVAEDEAVLADAISATATDGARGAVLHLPSTQATPGNISGNFILTSFSYDGSASDGSVEFSLEAQLSGAPTYTASV